jgi:hypothetical protein
MMHRRFPQRRFSTMAEARLAYFGLPAPEKPAEPQNTQEIDKLKMRYSADSWKTKYAFDNVQTRLKDYNARIDSLYTKLAESKDTRLAALKNDAGNIAVLKTMSPQTIAELIRYPYTFTTDPNKIFTIVSIDPPQIRSQDKTTGAVTMLDVAKSAEVLSAITRTHAQWIVDHEDKTHVAEKTGATAMVNEAWANGDTKFGKNYSTYDQTTIDQMSRNQPIDWRYAELKQVYFFNVVELEKHYSKVENVISDLEQRLAKRGVALPGQSLTQAQRTQRMDALTKQMDARASTEQLQTAHFDAYTRPFTGQSQHEADPRLRAAASTVQERYYLLRLPQGVEPTFVDKATKAETPATQAISLSKITLSGSVEHLKINDTRQVDDKSMLLRLTVPDGKGGTEQRYGEIHRNDFGNLRFTFETIRTLRTIPSPNPPEWRRVPDQPFDVDFPKGGRKQPVAPEGTRKIEIGEPASAERPEPKRTIDIGEPTSEERAETPPTPPAAKRTIEIGDAVSIEKKEEAPAPPPVTPPTPDVTPKPPVVDVPPAEKTKPPMKTPQELRDELEDIKRKLKSTDIKDPNSAEPIKELNRRLDELNKQLNEREQQEKEDREFDAANTPAPKVDTLPVTPPAAPSPVDTQPAMPAPAPRTQFKEMTEAEREEGGKRMLREAGIGVAPAAVEKPAPAAVKEEEDAGMRNLDPPKDTEPLPDASEQYYKELEKAGLTLKESKPGRAIMFAELTGLANEAACKFPNKPQVRIIVDPKTKTLLNYQPFMYSEAKDHEINKLSSRLDKEINDWYMGKEFTVDTWKEIRTRIISEVDMLVPKDAPKATATQKIETKAEAAETAGGFLKFLEALGKYFGLFGKKEGKKQDKTA